jgi:multidrug efflux system membrane fusion protein
MRYGRLFAVVLLAGAGAGGWHWLADPASQQAGAPRKESRRVAQRVGPVPVTVAEVRKETVPVYREGIGNVLALYTVTVRAQVDGRLIGVDFVEGQMVRKGDVLARIDQTIYKAQYDQAVAKKAQDVATLANARVDLARYQRLALSNAGPQQQADQQVALVAQLEAQIKVDDASIDNAKAYLDYTVIVSPIDGRTGLRLVDPGNIVHAADTTGVVSLTQITPISMLFTLPQRDLPVVASALARGNVAVEVMESEGGVVLARGTLQTIDNQIDLTTGTVKLKAEFPNLDQKLWPGQFATARVVVDTLVDAKVVPATAIRRGPSGTFVYVVGPDNLAVVQPVKVVLQDEARAVIAEGAEVGSRVVTVGFAQLSHRKPVQIVGGEEPAKLPGGGQDGARVGEQDRARRKREGRQGPERSRHEGKQRHDRSAKGDGMQEAVR